jgi:hypothetical protein
MSSLFKGLGKLFASKEKTMFADVLTLPMWFILDECIVHQVSMSIRGIKGFDWHYWSMPEEYCQQMKELKGK